MSTSAIAAYYSKKTGLRVSAVYGTRNPDAVETYTLDPALLKKNNIVQDEDGAAANLSAARTGEKFRELAQNIKDLKNASRRAARAAAKPNATSASVKKAIANAKPKRQVIHKSSESGEIVTPEFAKANEATTYATKGRKLGKKSK